MTSNNPPRLTIPTTSASPASTTAIQTGRPPLWTHSSMRKMCRLYLYTTLKIEEILEVVYHHHHDPAPGKDSANKKLSALLDKQPRWLRPVDEQDFYRRCGQLALSPVRTRPRVQWPTSRPHSASAPPPFSYDNSTPIKEETDASSATLDVPSSIVWSHQSDSPAWSPMPGYGGPGPSNSTLGGAWHGRSASADFQNGLPLLSRRSTRMSTSTDQTTGSLDQILDRYPEPYVRLVRKLVKRFTAPICRSRSVSPAFEVAFARPSWLNDSDAASSFSVRPFPLPGDFLNLDLHLAQQHPCFEQSDEHKKGWCMCRAREELANARWVTPNGHTALANHIINNYSSGVPVDFDLKDAFGNTLLHFLAARGHVDGLWMYLRNPQTSRILNSKNSAGQTFLHILNLQILHLNDLCHLLDFILGLHYPDGQRFDFSAVDHYGRTFFHGLLAAYESPQTLQPLLERYHGLISGKRDAFNIQPLSASNASPVPQQGWDASWSMGSAASMFPSGFQSQPEPHDLAVTTERKLVSAIIHCQDNPLFEDEEGRNGLHCLAAAALSMSSVALMSGTSHRPSPPRRRKKSEDPSEALSSSSEKLALRLSQAESLLQSGVDPNHYDCSGNTPLMAFVAQLPEDDDYQTGPLILQLLLNKGANIHARNRAGETALHIAVRCGRKLSVKTLLEHQANVHARDAAGRSLLSLADVKMESSCEEDPSEYAHYEACRAYLSGGKGNAVQEPSLLQEWGDFTPTLLNTTS